VEEEEKKEEEEMMMKKTMKKTKKLNVSDFHGRLLLFHRTRQAPNRNIFNCVELTGTEML
jgi:hypothetical protein